MVALAAVAGLLVACDIGDIRRAPPAPTPLIAGIATPDPNADAEQRGGRVPIPDDFSLQSLEFVDAIEGYALFTRCGEARDPTPAPPRPTCTAALLATVDGGRSWLFRPHPQPVAANQQLIVGDGPGELMLLAEPYGWYRSVDGGRSFRRIGYSDEPPPEYFELSGPYQTWGSQDGRERVVEYVGGRRQDLPAQPPLPYGPAQVAYDGGSRLFAAGLAGGRPVVAISFDRGRTWQRYEVPGPVDSLTTVWLELSAGGGDVWLLGQREPRMFPALWRFDGSSWLPEQAAGHPAQIYGAAAVGAGLLAVTGPAGSGLVGQERYVVSDWPLAGTDPRVLRDGTVMTGRHADGSIWLGAGFGPNRRWTRITIQPG